MANLKNEKAVKTYEGNGFAHYNFGPYRVTVYPNSNLVYMVLKDKPHKRVVGRHVEQAARNAIAIAQCS